MGVVNTTYTFTSTDTITSAKMNNIIDDTTFTSDAIQGTTLQVVSPGKLAVSAGGITSNELASNSVTTAKIADSNVTTAKILDANVTQAKLGTNVAGNGPAFAAYLSSNQIFSNDGSATTIGINTKIFDTASCFNTSTYRFTPNVAGYYQINASIQIDNNAVGSLGVIFAVIRKNGGSNGDIGITSIQSAQFSSMLMSGSNLIYLNGSTDYVDLHAVVVGGSSTSPMIVGGPTRTYMSGFLARSA